MANNNPPDNPEELGMKPYPKRTSRKKVFFDGDTWEWKQKPTKKKVETKKNSTQPMSEDLLSEDKQNGSSKVHCSKCMLVFKCKKELSTHQAVCLAPGKMESFLKNFPRRPDDPKVIIEKLVVPSSQSTSTDACSDDQVVLSDTTTKPSYAAVASVGEKKDGN